MNNVFKPIKYLSIIMLVVIISAVITYIVNPNFSDTLNSVSSNISKSVSQKSGLNLVVAYIFNNGFKVPMGMLFFSIIPIRFLYWIQPLFTVILPGILFGIVFRYSLAKAFIILISSLPHMLLEIFAFCLWMVALDRFNKWIRYKISRKKSANTNLLKELKLLLSPYIKYVLPLIVIAAFTETYVADWISHILS
ncbi:stage II sporulation protein M [Carnobacterium divergens]|uniref:stage II sporulation protein M n=1 Tax=Carnobacterium maltaromaticum TaxID=2751 RepID=UPI0010B02159|nr:stage II sporulation protein M [Carnobacterium maltaromaticum]EAC2940731.1 stage II sporulation protein M [Listeria monocytogenes]EAG6281899.1 stage II sporulation protein M [Listeria monocytogenes CFSAN003809]EAC5917548.1 stage II sporulation protein M [Listeria monocytogenes]EAC5920644.1 stage II sporulation protein M [Listeria monocytogenes]EAD2247976.1 stage II sporulation protein M [Listeria monocytogenes]